MRTPGDSYLLFATSQYSHQLPALASGQRQLALPTSSSTAQMPEWPYSRDERWVFETSEGTSSTARVATNLRSNISVPESSLSPLGYGRGLLQRGSSAPSILFEEYLADFNPEEVATLASSDPFRLRDDDNLLTWPPDSLAPVVERGPHQMDTDVHGGAASSSLDGQFLASQAGFERRISTVCTPTQSFGPGVVEPRSVMHQDGHGGQGAILPDHQLSYQLGDEYPGATFPGSGPWNYPTTPGMLEVPNSMHRGMGEIANNEPPGWLPGSSSSARLNAGGALEPSPVPMPGLIRHSSLPAKLRAANRGHATHPRSIAERVRRGKISERMKKLQHLVPNMEPQSNTADMLDEVVEYLKQLKLQVQELSKTVDQLQSLPPDPSLNEPSAA